MKRLCAIFMILMLMFCLVGCGELNLEKYKENKKHELVAYVKTLDYKDYSLNNWKLIKEYASNGKNEINMANDKNKIDEFFYDTMSKIKNINKENEKAKNISFEIKSLNGYFVSNSVNLSMLILNYNELINSFKDLEILWSNNPIWDDYSEDFFKDKAIIFYAKMYSGSNIKRYIDEVCVNSEVVKIHFIEEFNDITINTDYFCLKFIIEVNKSDINSVNNIEFIEK